MLLPMALAKRTRDFPGRPCQVKAALNTTNGIFNSWICSRGYFILNLIANSCIQKSMHAVARSYPALATAQLSDQASRLPRLQVAHLVPGSVPPPISLHHGTRECIL